MKKGFSATLCAAILAMGSFTAFGYNDTLTVIVNGVQARPHELQQLKQRYGTAVRSGRYWYDRASGLWGHAGGPAVGQIVPGLSIGGRLRANASGGASSVFVNGRALHSQEIVGLQQCFGSVVPGRYWMNAQGIGGFEGQAPSFNVAAACSRAGGRASSYRSNVTDTGVMSDGNGFVGIIGKGWSVTVD